MNRETLLDAQRCLTIKDGVSERKIVNLVALSENHDPDELIQILCDLYYEKHRFISRLLEQEDNSIILDMAIGAMFRMTQAIKLIKDCIEEEKDEFEQRTAASGWFKLCSTYKGGFNLNKNKTVPAYDKSYKGSLLRVCLVREGSPKRHIFIHSPKDIYKLVKKQLCNSDREIFLSILISVDGSLIGVETVSIGALDECLVSPREVFKSAILANAAKIIICHNHPSGCLNLSGYDKRLSKRLIEAGRILCIEVCDHIVVSHEGFTSHKEIDSNLFWKEVAWIIRFYFHLKESGMEGLTI
jgi:DNA repair protein RadC